MTDPHDELGLAFSGRPVSTKRRLPLGRVASAVSGSVGSPKEVCHAS